MANDIPPWEKEEFRKVEEAILQAIYTRGQSKNTFTRGQETGIAECFSLIKKALHKDYFNWLEKQHERR